MAGRLPTPAECLADPSKNAALVQFVNDATWESWTIENSLDILHQADSNLHLFLKHCSANRPSLTGSRQYRIALTQMACIAEVAVQYGDVPIIKFKVGESGEPPMCYLNTQPQYAEALAGVAAAMPGGLQREAIMTSTGPDGKPVYPRPLNDTEIQVVRTLIEQSRIAKMQAMQTGQPAPPSLVPPEVLIELNDMEMANALQAEFDLLCERSNFYFYITESGLWTNVYGTHYFLCQWDKEQEQWVFTGAEIGVAHPDPYRTDISRSRHFVWWELLGREEGMALYPDIADEISQYAVAGPPTMPGQAPYRLPTSWLRAYIYTEKVVVSHAFIRHTPYPLSPEQALAKGQVLQVPVTDPPPAQTFLQKMGGAFKKAITTVLPGLQAEGGGQNPVPNAGVSDAGNNNAGDMESPTGAGEEVSETAGGDQAAGGGIVPQVLPQPQRMAYYLPKKPAKPGAEESIDEDDTAKLGDAVGQVDTETGEIDPTHAAWPVRYGLREVTIIANHLISDHESERVDIPIGHNVNIPMPGVPWGQGEPERMEDPAEAFNSVVTDIVRHGDYSAFPSWMLPCSVFNASPELAKSKHVQPGKTYPVDDVWFKQFGEKLIARLDAGNLPTDTWKRAEFLKGLFDLLSDRTQAARGQSPTDNSSGAAINLLQNAVKTTTLFKSKRAEMMLKYMANVMRGDILQFRTPEQLAADVGKYPIHVWYELHRRLKAHGLDCAIDVQITSGSGATEQSHTAQIIQAAQTKIVPVSPQEIMRRLDLDPVTQMQENAEWQRDNMQIQQQVATAAGTSPGQPNQNPAPQSPAGMPNPTGSTTVPPPEAVSTMAPAFPPSQQ